MKNLPGQLYKLLILGFFVLNLSALASFCYETVILHYPDVNWRIISYERNAEEETITAKFIPNYDEDNNWSEMLIFHSSKAAKKANDTADSFIQNPISVSQKKFGKFTPKTIKSDPTDTVMSWCSTKGTKTEPPQCEIIRSTKGSESLITIQFITRNTANFSEREKIWLPIVQNAVVYYSYYRWDRIMNKAISVEL